MNWTQYIKASQPVADTVARCNIASLPYSHHRSVRSQLADSARSLCKAPLTALLWLSLALSIPAAVLFLCAGFNSAQENLANARYITVFLNPAVAAADAEQLSTTIAGNQMIRAATLTTTEVDAREGHTIKIQPAKDVGQDSIDLIARELADHLNVDYVDTDHNWLTRNAQALRTTQKAAALVVATALSLTTVLIFAMIRTDLNQRRVETDVLNQMGISHSTLQRTTLLRGLLLTFAACTLAILLAWGSFQILLGWRELSPFQAILPDTLSLSQIIWLPFVAAISCFLSVKLLLKI